jgi:hypothetical protein
MKIFKEIKVNKENSKNSDRTLNEKFQKASEFKLEFEKNIKNECKYIKEKYGEIFSEVTEEFKIFISKIKEKEAIENNKMNFIN